MRCHFYQLLKSQDFCARAFLSVSLNMPYFIIHLRPEITPILSHRLRIRFEHTIILQGMIVFRVICNVVIHFVTLHIESATYDYWTNNHFSPFYQFFLLIHVYLLMVNLTSDVAVVSEGHFFSFQLADRHFVRVSKTFVTP